MRSKLLLFVLTIAAVAPLRAAPADPYDQSRVPIEVDTQDPKLTKIVLIAGSVSSKSGAHEYFAGCSLFMKWLKETPGVFPVMAREGWPKNEDIFKGAKSVVMFLDGGIKHPLVDDKKRALLRGLMNQGAGLVLLHQGVDFPKGPDADILSWLGGVFLSDIGSRGHWDMDFKDFPNHPIMRGVKPFAAPGDGWLYNMHFAPDMKGVTALLTGAVPDKSRSTPDAKAHMGRPEIIAWSYERPNGGRSFGFTGCDLHKNWEVESQRRLTINGILWTAKVTIPESGAPVPFSPDDLRINLDDKREQTSAAKTPKAAAKKKAAAQ
jgi:hypothetical protein